MKEFYFIMRMKGDETKDLVIQYKNGLRKESVVKSPSGSGGAFISTDGNTMHLGNGANGFRRSERKNVGPKFEEFPIMRLTASTASTTIGPQRGSTIIGTILIYSVLIVGLIFKVSVQKISKKRLS